MVGVLWICGRVLRTGASPTGRVDKPVDNAHALPTALPTLSRLSPTIPLDQRQIVQENNRTTLVLQTGQFYLLPTLHTARQAS